jgi:hypothetical protein
MAKTKKADPFAQGDPRPQVAKLLGNIKKALPQLKQIADDIDGHWGSEDLVYRFYHQSFKVYRMQDLTDHIVKALKKLAPRGIELNEWFLRIVADGTGKKFDLDHNADWLKHTRPMLEAFFHARYFLGMVIKYGHELDKAPNMLPSGWASVLYLYGLR